jgi:hypothetical protein
MGRHYTEVMDRIEAVLGRHRMLSAAASRQEIDDLYTDACAMILTVEGERIEVDRMLNALLADSSDDPGLVRRSRDLAQRRADIDRDLASLRSIAAGLATAAEWMRDPASAEVDGLAEPRFARRSDAA